MIIEHLWIFFKILLFKNNLSKKKIFNYGRFRFVQIMNPGQCGETLGEAGGGGGVGMGARITTHENKELNFKKKHSAKKSFILHRSTGRAD